MTEMKTSWDLSPLLKNDDDPEAEKKIEIVKAAHKKFIDKWKDNQAYLEKPESMKQALDDFEKLMGKHGFSGDLGYYYELRHYQNQADPKIKAKLNKIEDLGRKLSNEINFFTLDIAKMPEQKQKIILSSSELNQYKHFLERLFASGKHLLSEQEEKILTLKQATSHDAWERMTQGIITKQEREVKVEGKKEIKNFSEILSLVDDSDKKIRDAAGETMNNLLSEYVEVAEAEMNAILANKKTNDELRNFERPDSSRHLADDVTAKIVDVLTEAVTSQNKIANDYYELKRKLLKLPIIHYYERNATLDSKEKKYPFEEAASLVKNTFQNIDKEFAEIFETYLKNGQLDVFPAKGKRNGAFCAHLLPHQPTYISLNHIDTLRDVSTIAHEVGHGINAELMNKSQNALNLGTPKSTAEVASTFMEDFVLEELLKKADDEEKLQIYLARLNDEMSTIFRQIAFYKFESELHTQFREKGYLSHEQIGEIFKKHVSNYLGKAVDISDSANWWVYIPHFRDPFYVYSYASGLLISKALQSKVKQNPKFIEKVKKFLSAGTSDSPKNIFLNLGIDITKKDFWLSGLKETASLLEKTETLAKQLGKI